MKNTPFTLHLKNTNPEIDIDRFLNIFEDQISKIIRVGPPDLEMKTPLGSDFNKAFTAGVLREYLKGLSENE